MRKQPNSSMCFVCGLKNIAGLKAFFYETDEGEVIARFVPQEVHQGYPGRLHGGIAAAILDETIGRALMITYGDNVWGVTVELNLRFRAPVPLYTELQAVARITRDTKRIFEGEGELILPDGTVAVTAKGKYFKLRLEDIAQDVDLEAVEWRVVPDDPFTPPLVPFRRKPAK